MLTWTTILILSLCAYYNTSNVGATTFNHQARQYNCSSLDDLVIEPFGVNGGPNATGPSFFKVPPASNQNESISRLPDREYEILSFYARSPLPLNSSRDDIVVDPSESQTPTNPLFNSRSDVYRFTRKYMSRIILGCYDNSVLDQIILDPSTRPFSLLGTSNIGDFCSRDGDYDFATVAMIQLLYVAMQYQNSMPKPVYEKIRDKLLSIRGPININNTFVTSCQASFLGITRNITYESVDTENHILQIQISRYLTNQLLLEAYPDMSAEYNNTANGNTEWMLQHLATFARDYFYEYNSKPYQLFTVKALTVLHAHANDPAIVLSTEMLLDIITTYSAIQMNALRRFVPFRRQPVYKKETLAWRGDSEFFRLAILAGNYHTLASSNYTLIEGQIMHVSTVASSYRIKDFIYPLLFRSDDQSSSEYFISNHFVAEMYYATSRFLISSGGHESDANNVPFSFPNRFCFLRSSSSNECLWDWAIARKVIEKIYRTFSVEERGWSRPTTIIPSNEKSNNLMDLIRFQGHRSSEVGSRNLCVGPNFACGLQLLYGNVVEPILDTCSIVMGDWRFIDFTSAKCLNYGYYMAVYMRSCTIVDKCIKVADHYGLLEISEPTMSFEMFQQSVLMNNPKSFASEGTQTYVPISGAKAIQFEIHPQSDDEAQIIAVEGISDDVGASQLESNDNALDTLALDRNYRNYPKAWSSKGSFQSITNTGRWTFDSQNFGQRYVSDVTDPLNPILLTSKRPRLRRYSIRNTPGRQQQSQALPYLGLYFDDSSSVIDNDAIESLEFHWNMFGVHGFRMKWRTSGIQSEHGYVTSRARLFSFGRRVVKYELDVDEYIVTVGIGADTWTGPYRINRIRIVTNKGREMIFGSGRTEDTVYNATESDHVISFYGRASTFVYELGVSTIAMNDE